MLQNTTTSIDWTTILVAIVTGVIGIVAGLAGARYSFKKSKEWDIDKEERRKEEELDKIKENIFIELCENDVLLKDNLEVLKQHTKTTPLMELQDDAWNFARFSGVFSGLLKELSGDISVNLAVVYTWVGKIRVEEKFERHQSITLITIVYYEKHL